MSQDVTSYTQNHQNQNCTKWIHALKMSASEVNWIHTWITGEPNSLFEKHGSYVFGLLKFQNLKIKFKNLKIQSQFWKNTADYPILLD